MLLLLQKQSRPDELRGSAGQVANARMQENDDALGLALKWASDKGYTVRYNQLSLENRHRTHRDHHGKGGCHMP